SATYTPENFLRLKFLQDELASFNGVANVLSLPGMLRLEKDVVNKQFNMVPVFDSIPEDQKTLDSLLQLASEQLFYKGQIINPDNGATLLLVSIEKEVLNSEKRQVLMEDVIHAADSFS